VKSKKRKIDEVSEISLDKGRKIDLRAIESKKQTIILQNPPSQIQETTATTTNAPAKNNNKKGYPRTSATGNSNKPATKQSKNK